LLQLSADPPQHPLTQPTASDDKYYGGIAGALSPDAASPPYNAPSTSSGGDVACPPHTTERRIIARIDAYIIPFI
jgi:hypothetical protein